ncbi:MAG: hypothetical protein K0R16_696 [Nitrososphaeraceae archaeon]|nr:hypothetical protein [Nitrososphaeraceae archaeon]
MTINPQGFTSSQNIDQDAIKHKKLTKVVSGYLEIGHFANADTHKGYFWQDIKGNVSGVIAPHAICSLWTPNEKEVH